MKITFSKRQALEKEKQIDNIISIELQREARYRFHQTKIFHEFLENSFYGC